MRRKLSRKAFALAACVAVTSLAGTTARADDPQAAPPSTAHTVSGVVALVGAAVALVALIVPLAICQKDSSVDAYGRTVPSQDPCDRVSDAAKVGWVAGGGIGLTLAVGGGIVFFMTALPPPTAVSQNVVPRMSISPFVTHGEGARFGHDSPVAGAALTLRF